MSYQQALEAAGARIFAFEQFRSYQGEWVALVVYNGEKLAIAGSYGSCSGCDAFEGEFGYGREPSPEALAEFGRGYLESPMMLEPWLAQRGRDAEWDRESATIQQWVRDNWERFQRAGYIESHIEARNEIILREWLADHG